MIITKEIVEYVAHLSRIELQPNELEKLSVQLEGILDFIDKLGKIDTKDIQPAGQKAVVWPPLDKATSHILPINNVLRNDEPGESLPSEKALLNAPSKQGNFFTVPKVIE